MRLDHLQGRCFLCGTSHGAFDTAHRRCPCVERLEFPPGEHACYVTIFPEPDHIAVKDLPSMMESDPGDLFAVLVGLDGEQKPLPPSHSGVTQMPFPYRADLLAIDHHLRCGNTTVQRSLTLEDVTGFGQVHVANMSTYRWSSTLKDPRSWAIVNTALEQGITDLAVWTAGNAGASLAKIVYLVNRRIPRDRRIQVYAIVDSTVPPEVRTTLRLWQCEVLDIFRRDMPILNPDEIRGLVAARVKRARRHLTPETFWDVTDGWDGVGLLMYRLIAAQIIRDVGLISNRPTTEEMGPLSVVVPVGTGNLLLGFYLGMQDCEKAGFIEPGICRIVGAVPAGDNILLNLRRRSIPDAAHDRDRNRPQSDDAPPLMPKLTSTHTPLAPCLSVLERERKVNFVAVTGHDQIRAARHVLAAGIDEGLACEPSALAAFAALPHVYTQVRESAAENRSWKYQSRTRLLVVNSGLGVLGASEEQMLRGAAGI